MNLYDSMATNGFNLREGDNRNFVCEETIEKLAAAQRGRTKENDEGRRRASKKMCGRPMHTEEYKKRVSEKSKVNKFGRKENWSKEKLERSERKKSQRELRGRIEKAKNKKLSKVTGTKLVKFILMRAKRPMKEKEVAQAIGKKREMTQLLRACKINTSTSEYLPNKETAWIERIKDENNRTVFRAKPNLTAWMIPNYELDKETD